MIYYVLEFILYELVPVGTYRERLNRQHGTSESELFGYSRAKVGLELLHITIMKIKSMRSNLFVSILMLVPC